MIEKPATFLPTSDVSIDDLLTRKEGQLFDRKSIRIQPRELAQALVAFANADGGEIAIGIANDGTVEGIRGREDRVNELIQSSINFCSPPVRISSRAIPCIAATGDEDTIVLVSIEQSERVHTTTNGDTYLRIGDESRRLSYEQQRQLMYDKGEQQYEDELVADIQDEAFDAVLLARFRERIGMEGDTERVLSGRYLARSDRDERIKVTRAGILLFHKTPALYFPTSGVRFVRYAGIAMETGVRQNVTADRRYEGPLPRIVEEVFRDLGTILRQFTRLNPRTSTFETEPEYPLFAWQEAIVNAVTHRAYNVTGQEIHIRLFEDRIEVESPGRLPGMVRIENMRDVHFLRNPRIARVMNDFGFVQELGEGVDRMYDEMASLGLPPPIFQERGGSLIVTLENDSAHRQQVAAQIVLPWANLTGEQQRLLLAMASKEGITPREAEAITGRSRPAVLRYLNDLVQKGLVVRRANAPNDPFTSYTLADVSLADRIRGLA